MLVLPFMAAVHAVPGEATSVPVVIGYGGEWGVNPYHAAFRAPEWQAHPATFIPGYPTSALALHLSFDAPSYAEAVERDAEVWNGIIAGQLYYIPGTRIIGAMTGFVEESRILDEHQDRLGGGGHGSMVVDAGSGLNAGSAPDSAIVVTTGFGYATKEYQAWLGMPWVDVWSVSSGCTSPVGSAGGYKDLHANPGIAESFEVVQRGHTTFNGAGYGGDLQMLCEYQAPWRVVVSYAGEAGTSHTSACGECNPKEIAATDINSYARHDSLDGTQRGGGTSAAAPRLAGFAARLIGDARTALGDNGGFRDGAFAHARPGAVLPARGPLADGVFDRIDLEDLLHQSARQLGHVDHPGYWLVGRITSPPVEQTQFLEQGYGLFDETEYLLAKEVLLGQRTLAERPWDDFWYKQTKGAQWAYWEPQLCRWDHGGDVNPSTLDCIPTK